MKLARHVAFIAVVMLAADATANNGTEARAMYNAASPSRIIAKAKTAGYHIQEDIRRLISNVLN